MLRSGLIYIFSISVFLSCNSQEDSNFLQDIKDLERERVITAADRYMQSLPLTVTGSNCDRSMGGPHDYYSEGDYWWPDPDNPSGPYIRKDGLTNPDNFTDHRKFLRRLSIQAPALVSAYILTKDIMYSEHAAQHLRTWFVDPGSRMNPTLLYAQAIKGRVSGRGIGIIDTIHLVEVVQAIRILEGLGAIDEKLLFKIKEWFSNYLVWMTTHEFGIKERDNGNNHSTCWVMQVAAFAKLVGNITQLDYCREFYKTIILPDQMAADGSFPKELKRTKPYGYSLFNLDAMATVCQLLSDDENTMWVLELEYGRGIKKAMEFMYPYIKNKTIWPHKPDVMYYDDWPVRHPALLFSGIAFSNKNYIDLWKTLEADPEKEEVIRNFFIRQPLLWIN